MRHLAISIMEKKNKIIGIFIYLIIFLFLLLIGSGNVVTPFFGEINLIDEGQFAAWINHLSHGQHLYKDTYAAYGPLYIYPSYLLSRVVGMSFFNLRIYEVIVIFISVVIVGIVLGKLQIKTVIKFLTLFFLIFIPGFGLRQAMGFLTILISYLSFEKKSLQRSFLSGVFWGITFLISSDIGIFTAVTLFILVFINIIREKKINPIFKRTTLMFVGLITVLAIFFIWTYSAGWFYQYIKSITDDLLSYSGIGIPIGQKFPNALSLIPKSFSVIDWGKFILSKSILLYWVFIFYLITFIYFFVKMMIKMINQKDILAFLISVYGFLIVTILIGRTGNFTFVLPPVFIILAYFLNELINLYKSSVNRSDRYLAITLCLIILIFLGRLISIYRTHFNTISQAVSYAYNKKDPPPNVGGIQIPQEQKNDIIQIQKFIWSNTASNDEIFFLSNNPGLYYLVDRISPTRFDLPEVANTKNKRLEIISDLEKDKTKYVIDYEKAYKVDGISNQVRLPEVIKYIEKNYSKSRLNNFVIYTRKNND